MSAVSIKPVVNFEPILRFEPLPLQIRLLREEATPGAGSTAVYQVWRMAEAERCRRCDPGLCTISPIPGHEAYATCSFVVAGHVSAGLASTLTRGI
jgi:hypothetical protein